MRLGVHGVLLILASSSFFFLLAAAESTQAQNIDTAGIAVPKTVDSTQSGSMRDTVVKPILGAATDTAFIPAETKVVLVRSAESFLSALIGSVSDKMGMNSELQGLITQTIDSSANAILSPMTVAREGPFLLYPFVDLGRVSIDPNRGYFLMRGPIVDFSQTHTSLPGYRITVSIDSALRTYRFEDKYGSKESAFKDVTTVSRDEYLAYNLKNEMRNVFTKTVVTTLSAKEELRSGAVRLFSASITTNETFQKIFGGDEVAVEASGNINLNVSVAKEKTSNINTTTGKNSSVTPKFEQKQQFNLRGTIGKKVEILIDQDSEREFDFENNIRLTYTGYDDEILQKLEAGNIELSLPGTELVTAGVHNKGLFGVKALFKIGDLNLTTIASIQRGEKSKITFNSSDGIAQPITKVFYDYAKAKFFFLGDAYREKFEDYDPNSRLPVADPANQIRTIRVFKSNGALLNDPNAPKIDGRALVNDDLLRSPGSFDLTDDAILLQDPLMQRGPFVELKESDGDFTYSAQYGILSLSYPLNDDDKLAVMYETSNTRYGQDGTKSDKPYYQLKLLWVDKNQPSHPTWDLELKNVYDFGGITQEDLKTLVITYKSKSATGTSQDQNSILNSRGELVSLLQILHLDEENASGAVNVIDDPIIKRPGFPEGVLVFPRLRPFDPDTTHQLSGFKEESYPTKAGDDTIRFPRIYDAARDNNLRQRYESDSTFRITVITKQKSSTIRLGINVLEGSEEVLLDGEQLEKDIGYTIDYFSGTITLQDRRATLPNANIEIRYENADIFTFEKKSLFGARAEYGLGELGLGANSFIGTTGILFSQSTINKRVQLGEEPFRNFVWDVNTVLDFDAKYLTRLANFLPLVNTNQPSKITLKGEYARLFPSANTSNGLLKDDENGVAYIDDFEAIKRTFPLGTIRRSWSLASTPVERSPYDRGKIVWYQAQDNREDISLIETPQTELVTTMGIAFKPKRDSLGGISKSWGGLMRGFSSSARNELADTRFVEFWLKTFSHSGFLSVELGAISENQNDNDGNRLNTEIRNIQNIYVTDAEDKGLDGKNDAEEEAVLVGLGIPPNSSYESLSVELRRQVDSLQVLYPWGFIDVARNAGQDPFGDNWDESLARDPKRLVNSLDSNGILKIKVNGLENNASDGTRVGDTEDLNNNNGNSGLDTKNAYFRYTIPLDTSRIDPSLIAGRSKKGWILLRIPVTRPDTTINDANLSTNFTNVRFWLSAGNTQDTLVHIRIAEPQFVSSQWLFHTDSPDGIIIPPNGKQIDPTKRDRIVEISSINTEESIEYATNQPPGLKNEYVSGQSGSDRRKVREQSLVLRLNELPGGARAIIWKKADLKPTVLNYGRMRMFVHGETRPTGTLVLPSENENTNFSPIRFFMRFGSNQNNYYEIEQPLFADWAVSRNSIDIVFEELTALKYDSSVELDSLTNTRTFDIGHGKVIRIKGAPSLSNLVDFYVGVINTDKLFAYSGDLWINELRLSDVNNESGDAARAGVIISIADLASLSASTEYRNANFRSVMDPISSGSSTRQSYNFSGTVNLQKFYIERWGISLPASFSVSGSKDDPKFIFDVLASSAKEQNRLNLVDLRARFQEVSDSLRIARETGADTAYIRILVNDSVAAFNELYVSENFDASVRTRTLSRGFNLSFSKAKSDQNNWLLRYTVDNVAASYSYNISESASPAYVKNKSSSWTSSVGYNLPLPRRSFKPFAWFPMGSAPYVGSLFRSIRETDFNYGLVTSVSTDFSISSNTTEAVERNRGLPRALPTQHTLGSSRGYGMSLAPLPSLTSSISVKYQTDLRGLSSGQILQGILSGLNPFDGFEDFSFDSPIDSVKRANRIDSVSYIFNRDFSTTNSFNLTYNPTSLGFVSHSLTYGSAHNSTRPRPASTYYYHNSSLNRRVQLDGSLKIREFFGMFTGTAKGTKTPTRRGGSDDGKKTRRDRTQASTGSEDKGAKQDTSKSRGAALAMIGGRLSGFGSKALSSINDIRINLSFENSNQIGGLGRDPDAAYRWFGYSTTRRNGFISNLFAWDLDQVRQFDSKSIDTNSVGSRVIFQYQTTRNLTYGIGYGFNFGLMTVDLKYDYSERRSLSYNDTLAIENRNITQSSPFPWVKPVPLIFDITIRLNNLGKWPLLSVVSNFTNSMNVSFSFSEKEAQSIRGVRDTSNMTSLRVFKDNGKFYSVESITTNRTLPQLNIDMMWKGNVSQNISFSNTDNIARQLSGRTTTNNKTVSSTLSYSKRGGFRLPLWFLKKKKLDNEVRIASTFNYTKRKTFVYTGNARTQITKSKTADDRSWSIEPRVDYSFTNRLTGGLFIKYENNKMKTTGTTTRFLGGLTINISIGT